MNKVLVEPLLSQAQSTRSNKEDGNTRVKLISCATKENDVSAFPRMIRANNRHPIVENEADQCIFRKPQTPNDNISALLRMMMLNLNQGAGSKPNSSQLSLNHNRRPTVEYSDTDDDERLAHYRQIKHFSHPHTLNKYDVERDNETNCKVCGLQLIGSAYGCDRCQFYLHVSCFDLPQKIQHGAHPAHPLTLRYPSYYKNCRKMCNACNKDIRRSFLYCCELCDFDLHVTCATLYSIARRPDSSSKDTLRLYYSFPISDNNNMPWIVRCNVCNKNLSKDGWLYYSKDTGYIAHIKCAKGAKVGASWIKEKLNMLKVKY